MAMTMEINPKNALTFVGPLNEKLTATLTIKNLSGTRNLAIKLKTNVYPQKLTVRPKRALIPPLGEITANFQFIPSRPRGTDRIQIKWCEMGSSFVTMDTFELVWSQAENFQQVESCYLDIVHVADGGLFSETGDANAELVPARADEVFEFGKSNNRTVSFKPPDLIATVENNPFVGWSQHQTENGAQEGQINSEWAWQANAEVASDELRNNEVNENALQVSSHYLLHSVGTWHILLVAYSVLALI